MSFDWSEYLYLGQELFGTPTKPFSERTKFRVIISRVYYAAFGVARNYLRDNTPHVTSTRKDAHWDVINQFLYDTNTVRRTIGKDLRNLFEYRKQADYDDDFPELSFALTQKAIYLANQVITRIERLK